MGAMDTRAFAAKSRGRSVAALYNTLRPHASLGFRPPAPEVVLPTFAAWPAALRRPASPTTQVVVPRPTLN